MTDVNPQSEPASPAGKSLRWGWIAVLAIFTLPYAILFAAGSVWLYQYHVLWIWLACALASVLAIGPLAHWMRRRTLRTLSAPGPDPGWPPAADAARQEVEAIARRAEREGLPWDRWQPWWDTLREVLSVVARHYRPRAGRPLLEIPVPHVLRVVELVAADLRTALAENVPGAHIVTIADMQRLNRLAAIGRRLYNLYRVFQAPLNPLAWTLREVRDFSAGKMVGVSAEDLRRWVSGFCVRRAGYYAIQLYSGRLAFDPRELSGYQSRRAAADLQAEQEREERIRQEPLRILVAGQVKAGKSSLVNALFGEPRAAVDVVPRTRLVDPYVLERDGERKAILLDTAGYEQASQEMLEAVERELPDCDLVLLVSSAVNAARDSDRRLLDRMRAFYAERPDRIPPPVVVVLTHVDQLRPAAQWTPPYDLVHPESAKAHNMAQAVSAVAEDLAVSPAAVVPVCLQPGRLYNVEETLVPALLEMLPEADRVQCLRCLREYHDQQYWRQLWRQAVNSGRWLWKAVR